MKRLIVGFIALLGCSSALAVLREVPVGNPPMEFKWSPDNWGDFGLTQKETTFSFGGPETAFLTHLVATPLQLTMRTLGSAITSQISSSHYAIKGKMKYDNVPAGSYLEMASFFAPSEPGGPEIVRYTRTTAASGPEAEMEGTADWRDFLLAYDASAEKTKLVRLTFNLHLSGKGTVGLWAVKLVQYKEGPSPETGGALVIVVLPGPLYNVDGIEYRPEALDNILKERHKADSSQTVLVKADKTVAYESIAALFDTVAAAGFLKIAFPQGPAVETPAIVAVPPAQELPSSPNPKKLDSFGQEILADLKWDPKEWADQPPPASRIRDESGQEMPYLKTEPDGTEVLKVSTLEGYVPLLDLTGDVLKNITEPNFAIVGEVRSQEVKPGSFLQMSTVVTSRQGTDSAMAWRGKEGSAQLEGTQDWHKFHVVAFSLTPDRGILQRIHLEVYGAGPGTLSFRDLKLVQGPDAGRLMAQPAPPFPAPASALPAGETVEKVPWNFTPPEQEATTYTHEGPSEPNGIQSTLKITYAGKGRKVVELRTVPYLKGTYLPAVTAHRFALVGEVRTEDVSAGTYLEMWSHFRPLSFSPLDPDQQFFTRGLAENGLMRKLDGTQGWREFSLPFDSTGGEKMLSQIDFNISFSGQGTVWLRNVKLVQYPDPQATPVAGTQPEKALPVPPEAGIHWRSFFLGVLASALGAIAGMSMLRLLRHLSRRRHEQELRRIASLDG